jgi:hypothetical protein
MLESEMERSGHLQNQTVKRYKVIWHLHLRFEILKVVIAKNDCLLGCVYLPPAFRLVYCSTHSLTKMEAICLHRVGSLMTVSRELSKYKSDLVGVQEVRWEGGGTEVAGEHTFFYGKGNENHELGT